MTDLFLAYNKPILKCHDITVFLSIGVIAIGVMLCINSQAESLKYARIFYVEVFMEYTAGIFIPLYLLINKKAIRTHLWNQIQNLFC